MHNMALYSWVLPTLKRRKLWKTCTPSGRCLQVAFLWPSVHSQREPPGRAHEAIWTAKSHIYSASSWFLHARPMIRRTLSPWEVNGGSRRYFQFAGAAPFSLWLLTQVRVGQGSPGERQGPQSREMPHTGVQQSHTPGAAALFSSQQSGEAEEGGGREVKADVCGALTDSWGHEGCQRTPLLFGNRLFGLCPKGCVGHRSEKSSLPTPPHPPRNFSYIWKPLWEPERQLESQGWYWDWGWGPWVPVLPCYWRLVLARHWHFLSL